MSDGTPCPTCGTPLPAGFPGGACPRCLLAAGLESGAGGAGDRAAPMPPEEMGRNFPSLEVLEVLGQGGMGIVYKARQRNLNRLVALKVLPPEAAREKGFAERFTREAQTLARLHHPHIVGVHDFGEAGGLYYLVMEYVDGPNLREVIRSGKLDPKQALAVVPQVCDALQYAHDQGVVHRDIKPENILLDMDGRVKIADFGLAKIVQRAPVDLTLTREGQVMGTLHYMAPEQYRAPDSVDHRADIYSLGVVFYEMLTGELPMGVFAPPSKTVGVDARFDSVVLRSLEKERDRRYQHASELRTQVDSIASMTAASASAAAAAASSAAAAAGSAAAAGGAAAGGPAVTRLAADTTPAPTGPPPIPPHPPRGPVQWHNPMSWFPPREVDGVPRLCRMAVAGGLAIPAAVVAAVFASLGIRLLSSGEMNGTTRLGIYTMVGFTGWILAMVAWGRINHSGRRLTGKPWAVVGALVTPVFLCCPAPYLLTGSGHSPGFTVGKHGVNFPGFTVEDGPGGSHVKFPFLDVEEGPDGTHVRMPGLSVDDGPGGTRVKMPGIDVKEGGRKPNAPSATTTPIPPDAVASLTIAADACLVHGGPEPKDAASLAAVARGIRAMWAKDGPAFGRKEVDVFAVGPSRILQGSTEKYVLCAVALEDDGRRGRAVFSNQFTTVSVKVWRSGDAWTLDEAEWETRNGQPTKDDEDGRLYSDWGKPKAPAAPAVEPLSPSELDGSVLATPRGGPPGLTGAERSEIGNAVAGLWTRRGADFVRRPGFKVDKSGVGSAPWTPDGQVSDYRVVALVLEADGKSGRIVVSDRRATISMRLERNDAGWDLVNTDSEVRLDGAKPDDADGRLFW